MIDRVAREVREKTSGRLEIQSFPGGQLVHRIADASRLEIFLLSFGAATFIRYVLRKELMQDIRGLRRDLRKEEIT